LPHLRARFGAPPARSPAPRIRKGGPIMPWIHIHHQVQDFNKWKEIYDQTAQYKRSQGWKRYRIYQVAGQRTDLIVMEQFNTLEQARAFATSDYLREAMEREGVVGAPEILLVDGLEEGPA
jgi:hypothetical protein